MTKIKVMMAGVPQGSHSAFIVKTKSGMNRAVITDKKKQSLNEERVAIAEEYAKANGKRYATEGISLDITFGFIKPKSIPKKVTLKTKKPDIDKLLRAVLDGLTGVAYNDDSQVIEVKAKKIYDMQDYIIIDVNEYRDEKDGNAILDTFA